MEDRPTRPDLPPSPRKPWVLYVLLAASLTVNVVLLTRSGAPTLAPTTPVEAAPPVETAEPAAPPTAAEPTPEDAPAAAAPAAPEGQAVAPAAAATEWQVVHATVDHSIARTFSDALGDDGPAVSAEYARLFVWDVDMQRDLLKGDAIAVIWRKVGEDYQIAAATLTSGKKGELRAYRFQAPGDAHPSFWRADGTEVPFRLVDGPLESYEQVTSLLKDRPTHKGMDFKTPVGTPIHAPRAGRVDKTNWNWQFNGNSVELHLDDGVVAKFLHMSANHVKPGDHVTKGQVIGLTGNTGRSTAPHLHYQLERGDRILDPLEYHQTVRRKMPAAAMADFTREVQRLDGLFAAAPVKAEP